VANTPSQTQQAIQSLHRDVGALTQEAASLKKDLSDLARSIEKLNEKLQDIQTKFVLLDHKVEELRKGKDIWSTRLWMVGLALVSAIIGGVLTAIFKKLFP
jgi:uncharacterized coiled-coil DUF342 family protein